MATNQTFSSFRRQVSISCFKTAVDPLPVVVSFIKNSINLIHQHHRGSLGAHHFSRVLRPGGHRLGRPRLACCMQTCVGPHLAGLPWTSPKIQNTFAAYKSEQEKKVCAIRRLG